MWLSFGNSFFPVHVESTVAPSPHLLPLAGRLHDGAEASGAATHVTEPFFRCLCSPASCTLPNLTWLAGQAPLVCPDWSTKPVCDQPRCTHPPAHVLCAHVGRIRRGNGPVRARTGRRVAGAGRGRAFGRGWGECNGRLCRCNGRCSWWVPRGGPWGCGTTMVRPGCWACRWAATHACRNSAFLPYLILIE